MTEALDLTSATGRAMAGLLAIFGEFEREIYKQDMDKGVDITAEEMLNSTFRSQSYTARKRKIMRSEYISEYIVVTGATSGIGLSLAQCFAASGYNVLAIGRNGARLQDLLTENKKIKIFIADLSNEDDLDKIRLFIAGIKIKYLVHCAAITGPQLPLTDMSYAQLNEVTATNVMAPIFLTQKLMPYFNSATRILFIGSDYIGANKIRPNITAAYAISKSALNAAVQYCRFEYKDKALIGYLNPGATKTPMYETIKSAVLNRQEIFNHAVLPADPNDVAKFIKEILENTTDHNYSSIDWDYRTCYPNDQLPKIDDISTITSDIQVKNAVIIQSFFRRRIAHKVISQQEQDTENTRLSGL